MWVERVLGNVGDSGEAGDPGRDGSGRDASGRTFDVDYVDVPWDECGRTLKQRTRRGEEVRVLLPPGRKLRHGDVLFEDQSRRVVVNVPPCEVIVARPAGWREMGGLALELGNLHWPAQVTDSEIVFIEDGPPAAVLQHLNIPWSKEVRRFEPTPVGTGPGVKVAGGFQVIRRTKPSRLA